MLACVVLLFAGVARAQQPSGSPYHSIAAPETLAAAVSATATPVPPLQAPVMEAPSPVLSIRFQPAGPAAPLDQDYVIQLEPPGLERLSRLDSDRTLEERIKQEAYARTGGKDQDVFPPSPILSRETYKGRGNRWPARTCTVEPNFTVYHRLYFEDKNVERYGWEFGPLQPLLSGLEFYVNVGLFPYHLANNLCDNDQASTGYCLPGDPVPFLIYPPVITVRGLVGEIGAISALIAIFP